MTTDIQPVSPLLTMRDLAAMLKVSLSTIKKWSALSKLRAFEVRMGEHSIRYRADILQDAIAKGVLFD